METSNRVTGLDKSQLADLVPLHCNIIYDSIAILYKGVLGKWLKVSSGVATLEGNKKDHKLHICLYSLTKRFKVFDIELYQEMNYTDSCCQVHTFSTEEGSYGLSFSNANHAQKFFEHVIGFLNSTFLKTTKLSDESTSKVGRINRKKIENFFGKRNKSVNRKNDKKLNIEVKMGTFKHVGHIGLSENAGLKISAESEELANELIKALNLKINNEMGRQFVKETIDKFGPDQMTEEIDTQERIMCRTRHKIELKHSEAEVKEAMNQKRLKQQAPQPPSSQQLPPPPPPAPPISVPSTESRHGELLDSIVNFNPNKLTKVNTAERKENAPDLMDSIENALIQMLNQRRGCLTQSDTDEDSDF